MLIEFPIEDPDSRPQYKMADLCDVDRADAGIYRETTGSGNRVMLVVGALKSERVVIWVRLSDGSPNDNGSVVTAAGWADERFVRETRGSVTFHA